MLKHAVIVAVTLAAAACAFSVPAQESLFSDANAYNPVPNPGGSKVAYVLTGRGRVGGSGGFGRSNMKSFLEFSTAAGQTIPGAALDFFLDRWVNADTVSCYRDWQFGLCDERGRETGGSLKVRFGKSPDPAERVTYLTTKQTFLWLDEVDGRSVLQTPHGPLGKLSVRVSLDSLVVPSPNEQYIAIASNDGELVVYNVGTKKSVSVGHAILSPDKNWDYMKPSWNPWFSDSSALCFSTGSSLYVASPDGSRVEEVGRNVQGYLPVPSPDGRSIAYVSFVARPMSIRPDLTFWGDAAIWIIHREEKESLRVTLPTQDTTLDLRWLDATTLIFDRMSDQAFPDRHIRIWTVKVPDKPRR